VAADAPTTDGSITPVRDNTRWPKQSETQFFQEYNNDADRTCKSNKWGSGFVLHFSLDHKRPVTEAASGAAASLVGGKISDRASAALTASGVGVGVGALGSGLVFALTPQLSGTQARAEELVVLMWLVLPVANALSDYVSLGISHFLARCVNHARSGWVQILSLVILDSVVAILLMAVTFLLIGWGLRLAETLFNIDYESTEFIARAAADPWRDGLWLTLMVLTTLFWTYVHLALVLAPVIAARIVGHLIERPLDTRIARRADEGKMEITAGAWLVLRHIAFACLVSAFALTPVWLVAALLDDFFAILI